MDGQWNDPAWNDRTMRAWRTHEYGRPTDVLRLDDVVVPTPEAGELLVAVQAIPLNLNDLERITGGNMMVRPELPYSPGMEVMGVVDACGDGAEEWQGRRVVAMPKGAHGGFAEYAVCPAVSTFEMPESIPLPGAAALYFPFHLAWLGLFDRAGLQAGESVLVHAAAGGSGSAAVQLAANAGARVFATAGTDEKLKLCRDLGADVTINYRTTDFADVVLAETANEGVDVVFDNVGEAVMEASMKCTKYNGRYLMMGFASNKAVADERFVVPRRVALGNLKLCGVLLAYAQPDVSEFLKTGMGWNFVPAELGQRIMREIVGLVDAGKVRPVVGAVVPFAEIPARSRRWPIARPSGERWSPSLRPRGGELRRAARSCSRRDEYVAQSLQQQLGREIGQRANRGLRPGCCVGVEPLDDRCRGGIVVARVSPIDRRDGCDGRQRQRLIRHDPAGDGRYESLPIGQEAVDRRRRDRNAGAEGQPLPEGTGGGRLRSPAPARSACHGHGRPPAELHVA